MRRGGQPWVFKYSIEQPSVSSKDASSAIGRCCIRSFPVMVSEVLASNALAVRNLVAVPALLRLRMGLSVVGFQVPAVPVILRDVGFDWSTIAPS